MKVNILGLEYDVEEWNDLRDPEMPVVKLAGDIDHNCLSIKVDEDLANAVKLQTIVHESMHAISFQYGLGFERRESFCERLGNAMFAFIKDNPDLVVDIINTGEGLKYGCILKIIGEEY